MTIYQSIYDGPPNNHGSQSNKRYIAIHNTANDATAEEEASYAKRRTDSVSSHYYVDSNSIVQSLDTDLRAWHAGSSEGNSRAIAYEITGVNGWTRAQWLDRVAWDLLAGQIRKDCAAHGITARDLSVAQIRAGDLTGVITHNEMRLAWGGTTHTDPGPNFPMDHLIALINEEDDMQLDDRIDLRSNGKRLWAGRRMNRDSATVRELLMWGLGEPVERAVAELRGEVAGLTTLVERLLTAPPVPITPEQLAVLLEQTTNAARAGAAAALERVRLDVVDDDGV